jgi:hypothetical protein
MLSIGGVLGLFLLAGCAGSQPALRADAKEAPASDGLSTGLDQLLSDDEPSIGTDPAGPKLAEDTNPLRDEAHRAIEDMSLRLAQWQPGQTTGAGAAAPLPSAAELDSIATTLREAGEDAKAASAEEPAAAPVDRVAELTATLRAELEARAKDASKPLADHLAIAVLEAVKQGSGGAAAAGNESPVMQQLSQSEQAAVRALRELIVALMSQDSIDPEAVASQLRTQLDVLAASQSVKIARVELCSRVDGFGQYTRLPGRAFLAGQTNRAIVYIEVEHFVHEQLSGAGAGPNFGLRIDNDPEAQYAVTLAMGMELTTDQPKPVLVRLWRDEVVKDVARNKRRDMYLTVPVEFPSTMGVGSYFLKLRVSDRGNQSSTESIIPIQMVADPSLITR